jgi:Zn-dependent protease
MVALRYGLLQRDCYNIKDMSGSLSLTYILIVIGVLLVSMTVHEAMHALVGLKLGDDTAAEQGRVSLNPLKHIDPFMTILLPAITLIFFQAPILAAKPVPFNPERVKYDEFGAALIAFAGPFSNLILAILGSLLARVVVGGPLTDQIFSVFIGLNVSLFVFNLIPIPPLDGSRVLFAFAPDPLRRVMEQIEPVGLFVIFGLILIGGFGGFITNLTSHVIQLLP